MRSLFYPGNILKTMSLLSLAFFFIAWASWDATKARNLPQANRNLTLGYLYASWCIAALHLSTLHPSWVKTREVARGDFREG